MNEDEFLQDFVLLSPDDLSPRVRECFLATRKGDRRHRWLPKSSRTSSRDTEPGAERVERAVVRGHRAPGEADSSTQKLAALV